MEILAAMQTRAQNEVAIEESPSFPKKCKKVLFHLGSGRRGDLAFSSALAIAVFFWLTRFMHVPTSEAFRRGRRNGHARARALPGQALLPGGIIGGLVGFGRGGNYLDFHIGSSWQR